MLEMLEETRIHFQLLEIEDRIAALRQEKKRLVKAMRQAHEATLEKTRQGCIIDRLEEEEEKEEG